MKVNLCFSGWLMGVKINNVYELDTGEDVSTNRLSSQQIIEGLNTGRYSIDFVAAIRDSDDQNVEMSDFEEDTSSE